MHRTVYNISMRLIVKARDKREKVVGTVEPLYNLPNEPIITIESRIFHKVLSDPIRSCTSYERTNLQCEIRTQLDRYTPSFFLQNFFHM